jgi:hypothetical protein
LSTLLGEKARAARLIFKKLRITTHFPSTNSNLTIAELKKPGVVT